MTQPLDVLKTRAMNAKPGEFKVSLLFTKTPQGSSGSFFLICLFILYRI